jgi:hypothetical protein
MIAIIILITGTALCGVHLACAMIFARRIERQIQAQIDQARIEANDGWHEDAT